MKQSGLNHDNLLVDICYKLELSPQAQVCIESRDQSNIGTALSPTQFMS